MKALSHAEQLRWVQEVATIDELIDKYPHEWVTVHHKLSEIYTTGDISSLQRYIKQETSKSFIAISSLKKETRNSKMLRTTSSQIVRARMVTLAVKNQLLKTSTGVSHGKIRFNYVNGFIAQKLFFLSNLKRKPVSLSWFRIIWPLIWQKNS